jgi:iron complex outermembrane receptor protein
MIDISQVHLFHFVNPKVGLTYSLNKYNDLYASYSIANREPNRNNFTEAGTNEQPTSERLFDTEIGYRFKSSSFSLGANLYHMKYNNQLILTGKISEIGELLTSNIPDSYRQGIEVMAGAEFTSWLRWDANFSLSRNKILNFFEEDVDVYDADWNWIDNQTNNLGTTDIAYSPNIVANNILTFTYKQFDCAFVTNYVGKQYIDNTSDDQRSMPAYFLNHFSAKYSLQLEKVKSIDFQVMVNNLFNEQYVSNGYVWYSYYLDGQRQNDLRFFPQAGTNFLASITLKF